MSVDCVGATLRGQTVVLHPHGTRGWAVMSHCMAPKNRVLYKNQMLLTAKPALQPHMYLKKLVCRVWVFCLPVFMYTTCVPISWGDWNMALDPLVLEQEQPVLLTTKPFLLPQNLYLKSKNTGCSSRGPLSNSQNPYCGSTKLCVTPVYQSFLWVIYLCAVNT